MSINIGVIDKDLVWRNQLIEILLKDNKFNITFARKTIHASYRNQRIPSIILVEIKSHLPGDLQTLNKLRFLYPSAKPIVISSIPCEAFTHIAFKFGVHGYLLKTSSIEFIKDSLLKAMEGERPISPAIVNYLLKTEKQKVLIDHFPTITKKENELIKYLLTGLSNKNVAQKMNVSINTINFHLKNIYKKLNINCKYELIILGNIFLPA